MAPQRGYVLSRPGREAEQVGAAKRYHRQELELMTIHQLREIARQERIIHGVVNPLDKHLLIATILRYRGAESALLIREYRAEDYEVLSEALRHLTLQEREDKALDCSTRITVYNGLAVDFYDELTVRYLPEFCETNAFLLDSEQNLCAIFNVVPKGDDKSRLYLKKEAALPCREADVKRYVMIFLERQYSELFFRFYNGEVPLRQSIIPVAKVELLDFVVKEPQTLKTPVAIDFGTANTVAGALELNAVSRSGSGIYHEKVRYACFYDPKQNYQATNLVPSVIGVLSLEDAAHPRYCFGYEAMNLASSSYIDEGFCLFYDIKRWIADYDKEEELIDKAGRRVFVPRKDILREFFLYIIHSLENRLKCRIRDVHLSCPVKQKHKFQRLFQEVLPDYNVERRDMIDEGVSVLYNTISEMIENRTVPKNRRVSALIIDCGGGTIDISSCTFQVEDRRVAYKIDIETGYENGSTDFGGNNLTYRILQLLKLRLVEALCRQYRRRQEEGTRLAADSYYGRRSGLDQWAYAKAGAIPSIQELMADFDREIFRFVDENGTKPIYERFEGAYQAAEAIIPTRFKDWETQRRQDYFQVRNNFYFLFQCAEQIKREFFEHAFTLKVILSATREGDKDWNALRQQALKSGDTVILPMDKWRLTVAQEVGLTVVQDLPDIAFSIFELILILAPDIYSNIHRFMDPLYESGELEEYSIIKMSGQSCKIDYFRTALKEFVPGKVIKSRRTPASRQEDTGGSELKMSCIDGTLKYLRDKKFGYADVTIRNRMPHLPYLLTGFTHTGEEVAMIQGSRDINRGVLSRNMDDLTLTLYLKDDQGDLKHEFVYYCTLEEFSPKRQEEIEELYGANIPQDDTDTIVDREVKFFVWADPLEWGFLVVPVYREEETLRLGREQFFSFEDDQWVKSFFDGTN
ncbi:MAG: molecular chaperone [Selenomonadaceae bacterium]|nr:molecular chaperone [Selenomonadaceae bacterium]